MQVIRWAFFSLALGTALAPSGAISRVSNYGLDVTFDPRRAFMSAIAVVSFDSTMARGDSVVFYLHGEIGVDSLLADGRRIEFNQQPAYYYYDYSLVANRVAFRLEIDSSKHLTVYYSGYFNPSKARSPSDYMRIDNDGVFLRSYGYSLWFPTFLESNVDSYDADFDVTLRLPREFVPVFAGERISDEVTADARISRWRATGLDLHAAQCTARRFLVALDENIYLYHLDDSASNAMAGKIFEFVRGLKGEYGRNYRRNFASGQMHIMEMPHYGDISSGNVVGISSGIWRDFESDEWSRRGLAHELVHPFVQTETKRIDSLYALMIEGFPSYFHLPILAGTFGDDWYQRTMKQTEDEYLRKKRTGLGWRDMALPPEKPLSQISADEVGEYKDVFILDDRALLFLNWLYKKMGPDRFFEFTRELFHGQPVTFKSFKSLIARYLPSSQEDIDLWLSSTEFPKKFYIDAK